MNLLRKSSLFALAGLAALSLVAVACSDDDDDDDDGGDSTATATSTSEGGGDEGATVAIQDNAFPDAEVAAGGTVTWDWSGAANPHSVVWTSDNAADFEDSETNTGSGDYEVTFDEAGTYEYECGVHGSSMAGTVVVT